MAGRNRSRRLLVLVTAIVVLLLAEGALVAYVLVSPSANDQLEGVAAVVQRTWEGTQGHPGVPTRIATTVHRGYQEWITPLWQAPQTPTGNPEFTACVTCHPDYAAKQRFNVYMDHPLHAQLGMECVTCHPQNIHPNPPRPLEKTCAECHDVNQRESCGLCHPPASLPHFYLLGAPKQSVVQCDVCHPRNTFGNSHPDSKVHGTFTGVNKTQCLSCHQGTTCQSCHGQPHPSDWVQIHGRSTGLSGATTCTQCHTIEWCSDQCHAVTSTNALPPRPLPSVGVRP
jgi:hypothetical protein